MISYLSSLNLDFLLIEMGPVIIPNVVEKIKLHGKVSTQPHTQFLNMGQL